MHNNTHHSGGGGGDVVVGSQRAIAVRQRLIDVLEMSVVRMSFTAMPAATDESTTTTVDEDRSNAHQMGMIVQLIQQCAEGAFSVYVQILRNGGVSDKEDTCEVNTEVAQEPSNWSQTLGPVGSSSSTCCVSTQPFREYATADPSPGFELQGQCAELMSCLQQLLLKSNDPDHIMIPKEGIPAAKSLLSLLLELQSTIHSITTVAVEAMDLVNSYSEAAGVKEAELRAMVKWYYLSSQAAREWKKEAVRRELARQSLQQRTQTMQRELDRMVDEETLSRTTFANRWAAYLPKGGFATVSEQPAQLRIAADASSSSDGDASVLSTVSSKSFLNSPKK